MYNGVPMDLVADIKSHINVEDLVASYVQLKRVGRNFKGLCPFHTEKSPSFYVSAEKQLAYCFGCHQGGDIFQFFQLVEGVDFSEALKLLAERAGLDYAQYRSTTSKMPSKSEKQILLDAHEKATAFFETQLWETPEGSSALEYIRKRGLSDETIRRFRIGFAPDSFDALYNFLSQEKISKTSLIESGLVISKDTSGERVYDRFRLRLMFPIKNAQGQIVAFGGRALKKESEPKYLNSPETILYHKSEILYGFFDAKNVIREKGALLVEGYMDVIACHQAGFSHAVATSGTALTAQQVQMIHRLHDRFYFCFDRDNAGWEASKRGFLQVIPVAGIVRVVEIPSGKDPDECIKESPEAFTQALEHARPFFDVYLDRLFLQYPSIDSESAPKILSEVVPMLQQISSQASLDFLVRDIAKRLSVREASIYDALKRDRQLLHASVMRSSKKNISGKNPQESLSVPDPLTKPLLIPEEILIAVFFRFPEKIDLVKQHFPLDFLTGSYREVFTFIFEHGVSLLTDSSVLVNFSEAIRSRICFLSFYAEQRYDLFPEEEFQDALDKIWINHKNAQVKVLEQAVSQHMKEGRKQEAIATADQALKLRSSLEKDKFSFPSS